MPCLEWSTLNMVEGFAERGYWFVTGSCTSHTLTCQQKGNFPHKDTLKKDLCLDNISSEKTKLHGSAAAESLRVERVLLDIGRSWCEAAIVLVHSTRVLLIDSHIVRAYRSFSCDADLQFVDVCIDGVGGVYSRRGDRRSRYTWWYYLPIVYAAHIFLCFLQSCRNLDGDCADSERSVSLRVQQNVAKQSQPFESTLNLFQSEPPRTHLKTEHANWRITINIPQPAHFIPNEFIT